jgi:hypothetical protein
MCCNSSVTAGEGSVFRGLRLGCGAGIEAEAVIAAGRRVMDAAPAAFLFYRLKGEKREFQAQVVGGFKGGGGGGD